MAALRTKAGSARAYLVAFDLLSLTELAEDLPVVRGDRVELQQVILNLIHRRARSEHSLTQAYAAAERQDGRSRRKGVIVDRASGRRNRGLAVIRPASKRPHIDRSGQLLRGRHAKVTGLSPAFANAPAEIVPETRIKGSVEWQNLTSS